MHNYIIVRVIEDNASCFTSNAGIIRKALHKIAEDCDILVADNIIKEASVYPNGKGMPFKEAEDLFAKVMPK